MITADTARVLQLKFPGEENGWSIFTEDGVKLRLYWDEEVMGRKKPSEKELSDWTVEADTPKPLTDRQAKDQRDKLLSESDWTQLADSPLSSAKQKEWKNYRKALRDLPKQEGFPAGVTWPAKPE